MSKVNQIDKEVSVTAVYFGNGSSFKSFPRQIECDGDTYTFSEGLQLVVKKGQELFKIFDMTDGSAHYRLRNDTATRSWRLLSITQN